MRAQPLLVSLLAAFAMALPVPNAHAGCPNTCELTTPPVTVTPALDCIKVAASPQTCDCAVFVTLTNQCSAPVDAVGFTFSSCGFFGSSHLTQPCPSVDANKVASLRLTTTGTGHQNWNLSLREQGAVYVASVNADVTSFNDSGGCAVAREPVSLDYRLLWPLALVGACFARAMRRTRARSCQH
jgi:hypothetical protein